MIIRHVVSTHLGKITPEYHPSSLSSAVASFFFSSSFGCSFQPHWIIFLRPALFLASLTVTLSSISPQHTFHADISLKSPILFTFRRRSSARTFCEIGKLTHTGCHVIRLDLDFIAPSLRTLLKSVA